MVDDCLFCKIVQGTIPCHKVFDDEHTLAFLDIRPLTRGHTLVIPKAHDVRFEDLSSEAAQRLMAVVHRVLPAVGRAVGASGSTLAINNGREGGQEVPHVHVHVIPRTAGDGGGPIHGLFAHPGAAGAQDLAKLAEIVRAELRVARRG